MVAPVYCDLDDIRDVLTRDAAVSAELQNNGSTLDEENLAAARLDAQSEIDARLATKYTVPFAPVPTLIMMITVNIAAWLADLNFRENRDMETELNPIYQRYQRAQALLGQLSTGEAIIPPDGSDPETPDPGSGIRVAAAYSRPPLISWCDFDLGYPTGQPPFTSPEGWAIH
jgi:phage gp36-like protein